MTTAHEGLSAAVARLTGDGPEPRLNLLLDPPATEVVGLWIADQVRSGAPDHVVTWDEPQSAVLAYVVARALGGTVVLAVESEGLVDLPDAPGRGRAVLVADRFATMDSLTALLSVVESRGLAVAAVAAATGSESLDVIAAAGRYPVVTPSHGGTA
ncbi:hypothetical protein [Dactylosporangium sp. NPDC051541]|uniref:hypothetical protein n=1 Tax=Dactylosporangium sp. NPDC051541 TaxID=3363977 RepID=UPI0037A2F44D